MKYITAITSFTSPPSYGKSSDSLSISIKLTTSSFSPELSYFSTFSLINFVSVPWTRPTWRSFFFFFFVSSDNLLQNDLFLRSYNILLLPQKVVFFLFELFIRFRNDYSSLTYFLLADSYHNIDLSDIVNMILRNAFNRSW